MKSLVHLILISTAVAALSCSTRYTARGAYEYRYKIEPYSVLAGKVVAGPEGRPVAARVTFPGTLIRPVDCTRSGIFCATTRPGTYLVKIEADGFESVTYPVVLAAGQSLARDFYLRPTDFEFSDADPSHPWIVVYFDPGSAVIADRYLQTLDRVAAMIIDYVPAMIEIRGYTDAVGGECSNLVLSQERADAVREYLVRCGVEPSRLVSLGCGENAGFDNETRKGKILNRRAELVPLVWR